MSERTPLSSNHFSVDDQTADVLSFLSNATDPELRALSDKFVEEFPEYNSLEWSGSWADAEASGVDVEYMNWVRDWIENNTPVYWEDGEPYLSDNGDDVSDLAGEIGLDDSPS